MTEALVSRERLWYGDLPAVCVKTGAPAEGTARVRFERLPPWTFLLLFAGIFPFFIALLFVRDRVQGEVPVTRAVLDRYHALKRGLWLGWGWIMLGVSMAVVRQEPIWLLFSVVGVLWLLGTEIRRSSAWIAGVPVRGTPFVELRRVHPDFAAAVAREVGTDRPR